MMLGRRAVAGRGAADAPAGASAAPTAPATDVLRKSLRPETPREFDSASLCLFINGPPYERAAHMHGLCRVARFCARRVEQASRWERLFQPFRRPLLLPHLKSCRQAARFLKLV